MFLNPGGSSTDVTQMGSHQCDHVVQSQTADSRWIIIGAVEIGREIKE